MSLSYVPLNPVSIIDPIQVVQSVKDYGVVQSAEQVSFKQYTTLSISSSSLNFSCPPPSPSIITDRNVKITLPVRLTFTGVLVASNGAFVPNSTLLNAGFDAPRAFPFSSMTDVLQVTINNDSYSINMGDVIHPLSRYGLCPSIKTGEYSTTPNMMDNTQNYSDTTGSLKNPLNGYLQHQEGSVLPRGASAFTVVSNPVVLPATGAGTAATAIVDLLVTENFFLSPFSFSKRDAQGFYNVNAIDIVINILAQAGMRCWSHSTSAIASSGANTVTSVINTITVQFNNFSGSAWSYPNFAKPIMLFRYITPNLLSKQLLSPNTPITYPYNEVVRYPTDMGLLTFAAGPAITASNVILLNQIPSKVFIFARPSNQSLQSTPTLTDSYLAITNVQVQWANTSVCMSTASQYQLYELNRASGSTQSWEEWSGQGLYNSGFPGTAGSAQFSGSCGPLCLQFGTPNGIQLRSDEAPGLKGQYQILVTTTFQNTNSSGAWDAIPMTYWLVFILQGTMTIVGTGSQQHHLAPLTKTDILNASQGQSLVTDGRAEERMEGGDFLGSLGNFISGANDFLQKSKLISTVGSLIPHPAAKAVSGIASTLGYGQEGGCHSPQMGFGGSAIQGPPINGGRRMTKSDIKRHLM